MPQFGKQIIVTPASAIKLAMEPDWSGSLNLILPCFKAQLCGWVWPQTHRHWWVVLASKTLRSVSTWSGYLRTACLGYRSSTGLMRPPAPRPGRSVYFPYFSTGYLEMEKNRSAHKNLYPAAMSCALANILLSPGLPLGIPAAKWPPPVPGFLEELKEPTLISSEPPILEKQGWRFIEHLPGHLVNYPACIYDLNN